MLGGRITLAGRYVNISNSSSQYPRLGAPAAASKTRRPGGKKFFRQLTQFARGLFGDIEMKMMQTFFLRQSSVRTPASSRTRM